MIVTHIEEIRAPFADGPTQRANEFRATDVRLCESGTDGARDTMIFEAKSLTAMALESRVGLLDHWQFHTPVGCFTARGAVVLWEKLDDDVPAFTVRVWVRFGALKSHPHKCQWRASLTN